MFHYNVFKEELSNVNWDDLCSSADVNVEKLGQVSVQVCAHNWILYWNTQIIFVHNVLELLFSMCTPGDETIIVCMLVL